MYGLREIIYLLEVILYPTWPSPWWPLCGILTTGMQNWNQDHPERYSNFCRLYIKFSGVRIVAVDQVRSTEKSGSSALPPWSWKVAESMYKYLQTHWSSQTVYYCSDSWKLRQVAGKACNMTENALSILIVIFSVQVQQTDISDRKLFIFQHGLTIY